MWRRLKRRTLAPTRPAVYPEQWGLVLVASAAIVGGVVFVAIWVL